MGLLFTSGVLSLITENGICFHFGNGFRFGNIFLFPDRIVSSAPYRLVSETLVNRWGRTTACKLRFHLSYYKYLTAILTIPRPSAGYNESQNDHAEPWIAIHDRIKPSKVKISKSKILGPAEEFPTKRPVVVAVLAPDQQLKVSAGINKNLILSEYQEFCIKKGHNDQAYTVAKGKTPQIITYPTHHRLIADCKMKPSTNLYYRVKDLHFDNVAIFLIKWHELYLTNEDLNNMRKLIPKVMLGEYMTLVFSPNF